MRGRLARLESGRKLSSSLSPASASSSLSYAPCATPGHGRAWGARRGQARLGGAGQRAGASQGQHAVGEGNTTTAWWDGPSDRAHGTGHCSKQAFVHSTTSFTRTQPPPTRLAGVRGGSPQLLLRHLLHRHTLHHLGTRQKHVAAVPHLPAEQGRASEFMTRLRPGHKQSRRLPKPGRAALAMNVKSVRAGE